MTAKERHRKLMLEHWGDPANTFCSRIDMHNNVLRITQATFYAHFTPLEITEIENEAAIERRKKYARERSNIIDTLYKEGKAGNVQAIKEFLDRVEGKVVEKSETKNEHRIVGTWKTLK